MILALANYFLGHLAILRLLERLVQVLSHSHCPMGLVFGVSWVSALARSYARGYTE